MKLFLDLSIEVVMKFRILEAKLRNYRNKEHNYTRAASGHNAGLCIMLSGAQKLSSPVLGLYGQLKCFHSRLDSACSGSSVWEMSPGVGVVEGVGEQLCLWWVKLSLQTIAPRWVHCHHLQKDTSHLYEFL